MKYAVLLGFCLLVVLVDLPSGQIAEDKTTTQPPETLLGMFVHGPRSLKTKLFKESVPPFEDAPSPGELFQVFGNLLHKEGE
ncbi:UNVERIFIED_CONTAM: hypothetical protein PYX00_002200 [Menopon gallinae]|uniref:Secreted protein n=1 Tax=Menopon gallinae TaxID=328185 RepID=A0AAW2IG08_9NEOP